MQNLLLLSGVWLILGTCDPKCKCSFQRRFWAQRSAANRQILQVFSPARSYSTRSCCHATTKWCRSSEVLSLLFHSWLSSSGVLECQRNWIDWEGIVVEPPTSYFNRKELCLPSCCTYICQKLLVSGLFTCLLTFEVAFITACQLYQVNHFQGVWVHHYIWSSRGVRDVLWKIFLVLIFIMHQCPILCLVQSSDSPSHFLLGVLYLPSFDLKASLFFFVREALEFRPSESVRQITPRTWSCLQLYLFPSNATLQPVRMCFRLQFLQLQRGHLAVFEYFHSFMFACVCAVSWIAFRWNLSNSGLIL